MSNAYASLFNPSITPQSEPIPGKQMVANNAGGYVFEIDKWARLRRFLVIGSDAPTYYQSAKDLTRQNGENVIACWKEDPARTVEIIEEISLKGLAPKNDPAIFALALGSTLPDPHIEARQRAFVAVPLVCRTGTHLFTWLEYRKQLGGGDGRGFQRTVRSWYAGKLEHNSLALQAVKYRQRNGWTHKDALAVANMGSGVAGASQPLLQWMKGKEITGPLPALVLAHAEAMAVPEGKPAQLIGLIEQHNLPREALPTWALNHPEVWQAMLPDMPLTAMIRNLGVMTSCGAINPQHWTAVAAALADTNRLRKSRVHPFAVLLALAVYRSGHGDRGKKTWHPVPQVIDALDAAFYAAFGNVPSTGKRIMLALDVSGSMGSPIMGSPLTCREAAAAMALVTMAAEPQAMVYGFTSGSSRTMHYGYGAACTPLAISPRQRLDDVVRYIANLRFGGTDCALPFVTAQAQNLQVDGFALYTDDETWGGNVHPVQALRAYRKHTGIAARSAVVAFTSTGFSIADPSDGGMMDFIGADASMPAVLSSFIGGEM